ncbi:MAG: C10 family peptidase [Bacteroidales bacterium]|nr:C10 family peptidase [Bacteroidales bacterium]
MEKVSVYLFVILGLIFFSCEKSIEPKIISPGETKPVSILTKSGLRLPEFFVSETDVEQLVYYLSSSDDSRSLISVNPIQVYGGFPQAYLLSYDKGWKIISADKRTDPVIAESPTGSFLSMSNEARDSFLNTYYQTIHWFQTADSTSVRNFAHIEGIQENERFWELIGRNYSKDSPSRIGTIILDVEIDTVDVSVTNHLIQTQWHQLYPYNKYCPELLINGNIMRGYAGCVPIAGAQLLYYLNSTFGFPVAAPNYAYCYGIYPNHSWDQTGTSTTIWNSMPNSDGDAAAILIANLAKRVNASFYSYGTFADMALLEDAFQAFDVNVSSPQTFLVDSVYHYITNRSIPVISGAFPENGYGHCFLIDAYKQYRLRERTYYQEMNQNGVPGLIHSETVYHPFNKFVGINWGYGGVNGSEWYSAGDVWQIGETQYCLNKTIMLGYTNIAN